MPLYKNVDRIYAELVEAGLDKDHGLSASDLTAFDQYHYHGTDAIDIAITSLDISTDDCVLEYSPGDLQFDVIVSWLAFFHFQQRQKLLASCMKLCMARKSLPDSRASTGQLPGFSGTDIWAEYVSSQSSKKVTKS